jgi:carboxyl-terminal processing protease
MKRLTALALVVLFTATTALPQRRQDTSTGADPGFDINKGTSFYASRDATPPSPPQPLDRGKIIQIIAELNEAMELIRKNHAAGERIDYNALTRSLLDSALRTLDPHSSYFDAAEFRELLDEEQSEYSGIGATIVNFQRGGQLDTYVVATVPNSPAANAKLRFGDRIIKVDDQDVTGRDSADVSDAVRGESGTHVRLLVEKAATGRTETVEVRRSLVAQPSIRDAFLMPGGVGYVDMTDGFNYTTANELGTAIKFLHRLGATSLILDLRDNPGGILEQAVKVAEKFLPSGAVIVSQHGRAKIDDHVWKSTNKTPETMPLVLLVNENTASASEVVAGALQDHDRALIVGQKTFGKGLVQSVFDMPFGSGLTLTTARYFTPSGRLIQRDYSNGNLYDYYNHRSSIAPQDEKAARTAANRPVFGGDGIAPDDQIAPHDLTKTEQSLLDLAFLFSRDAVYRRLETRSAIPAAFGPTDSAASLVNDKLVSDFSAFAEKMLPGLTSSPDYRDASSFISERLKFNFVLASRGETQANRLLLANDPMVLRALSQLPKAKELASAASRPRPAIIH